jgi:phosphohistidine phosphatase
MDLILWRHADAEETGVERADLERDLTARGERQAARMARWLHQQLPHGVRILASPARRAQLTAMALDRKFRTVEELAPGASPETILAAAGWPDAKHAVLIVGHQPYLGQAAALVLTGKAADWSVRKAAVWWLRQRERDGAQACALHCVQSPETI